MEILTQLGLTGVEAGLGVAVIGLGVVLAVVVLRNQSKASDGQQSHLAFLVESLSSMKEDQTKLRGQIENMTKVQETVRAQMSDQLQSQEREIRKALEERLADVTRRVGENLQKTTEKTSESLTDLQKRLAVIDAAQKNIADLSTDIVGLQDILSNKQARGAFGQVQMEDIVRDMLPADYFKFEATLSNNKRVDCLITLPGSHGAIGVDSKYPHEGFVRLMEAQTEDDRKTAGQAFTRDVIKHVQDIAEKYIIPGRDVRVGADVCPGRIPFTWNCTPISPTSFRKDTGAKSWWHHHPHSGRSCIPCAPSSVTPRCANKLASSKKKLAH